MGRLSSPFFVILSLVGVGCTTRPNIEGLNENLYHKNFLNLTDESQRSLTRNSEVFFEWAQKDLDQEIEDFISRYEVFKVVPEIRIHGGPTPYMMKRRDRSIFAFTRTENSREEKLLFDLVHMEVAALFASEQFRLDLYRNGSCIDSYIQQIKRQRDNQSPPSYFVANEVESFAFELDKKRSSPNFSQDLSKAMEKAVGSPIEEVVYEANPRSPTGSPLRFLRLENGDHWRASPLLTLEDCDDYQKTLRFYGGHTQSLCYKSRSGTRYILEKIAKEEEFFVFGSYHKSQDLSQTVGSLCAQLAYRHRAQLNVPEQSSLYFLLSKNKVIKNRLLAFARDQAKKIVGAYRASLF